MGDGSHTCWERAAVGDLHLEGGGAAARAACLHGLDNLIAINHLAQRGEGGGREGAGR